MLEQRTYLPSGVYIEGARMSDVPNIAELVSAEQSNAFTEETFVTTRINELRSRYRTDAFKNLLRDRYTAWIQSPRINPVFVARARQGLVGVGSGDIDKYGHFLLGSLYTSLHGIGVGTSLMDRVDEEQMRAGARRSDVEVIMGTNAVHFYENRGYDFAYHLERNKHDDGTAVSIIRMYTRLPRRPGRCTFLRMRDYLAQNPRTNMS